MFITPQDYNEAAQQAVAMQEIEVVSMDDGEENITLSASTLRSTTPSTLIESSPPPLLPCLSSSPLSTPSTASIHSPAMPPQSIKEQQEESLEILLSMLSKEQTLPTIDYTTRLNVKPTPISIIASSDNRSLSSNLLDSNLSSNTNSSNSSSTEEEEPINNTDRTKMCDWYYEMSDFLKISRSTASRSLTLLDRFMSTDVDRLSCNAKEEQPGREEYNVAGVVVAATQNRDEYQLVALTALFLSIKLYERLNIQPEHVSYLSRGRYTSEEVIKMEIVMLQALEWKVCVADKIDYVTSFLDVMLPSMKRPSRLLEDQQGDGSSSSTSTDNVLSSMKELATLQIQLSDFDPSYSTQRPSLVAFAAVINAFELKKDKLSNVDQSTFLTSVHVLMDKMYPLNDFLSKSRHTRERQELGSTVDRLRILVDPPSAGNMCGVMDTTTTPVELTPTSYQQRYQDAGSESDDDGICSSRSCHDDDNSTSLHDRQVSPLDMALESMENFDMAQLLCCGMPHRHHPSASSYQATDTHAMYNDKNVMDMMDTDDDEEDEEEEEEDPAAVMSAASHQHLLESATSFGSNTDRQHSIKVTNSVSPTSIATILFGGGASNNKK